MTRENLEKIIIMDNERCYHYKISRLQRYYELIQGKGYKGTDGYMIKGCYTNCKGYNYDCESYVSNNILIGDVKK